MTNDGLADHGDDNMDVDVSGGRSEEPDSFSGIGDDADDDSGDDEDSKSGSENEDDEISDNEAAAGFVVCCEFMNM